jgi:hypothetical protein
MFLQLYQHHFSHHVTYTRKAPEIDVFVQQLPTMVCRRMLDLVFETVVGIQQTKQLTFKVKFVGSRV